MANTYNHGLRLRVRVMYKECLHNHAGNDRGHVLDGCGLFEATGPNGTPEAMVCATCSCHRNFHRRVKVDLPRRHKTRAENDGSLPGPQPQVRHPTSRSHPPTSVPEFIDLPPQPQVYRETSTSHERKKQDLNQPQEAQNHTRGSPLSPERVEGYFAWQAMETGTSGQKTKITGDQSERLKAIADRNYWKMFRNYSKAEVSRICSEVGIERECLKAWIFYHKNERAARQAAANFRTAD